MMRVGQFSNAVKLQLEADFRSCAFGEVCEEICWIEKIVAVSR